MLDREVSKGPVSMRYILFFLLVLLFSAESYSKVQKNCEVITAKHAKGILDPIEINRCKIGVGGFEGG